MCDIGNLIDLTGWDEPVKDEEVVEDTPIQSNSFKGPYDPFDSVEKEACIKGEHFKNDTQNTPTTPAEGQLVNNESSPLTTESEPSNSDIISSSTVSNESRHRSLQQLAKLNATRLSNMNTPPSNQLVNVGTSGNSSYFNSCFLTENLQMIAAESPVKLIEDEPNPIPTTMPSVDLPDYTCSNTEFEVRLKQMRIAMLGSPAKSAAPDPLAAQTTQNSHNTPAQIEALWQELKFLVYAHVEPSKREQFNAVIESLRTAFQCNRPTPEDASQVAKQSPIQYTRQGTFDLDLEQQRMKADAADHLKANGNIQEFPDVMTCSSATYDAESADKPMSPIRETEFQKKPDSYVTEVVNDNNLAQQINQLLERHNLTKQQVNDNEPQHHESETNQHPSGQTVILVVNSTAGSQLTNCIVHPSSARVTNAAAKTERDNALRRRSSSLSIHDKAKQERPKSIVKQSSEEGNESNLVMPLKELSTVGDKFNAMSSFRQRRNSFSIASIGGGKGTAPAPAASQARGHLVGRTKVTAINETVMKLNATSKANSKPVKRVVPMVKPSLELTDVTHLNSTTPRCNVQDTPLTTKAKQASKLFCTSTPMPQVRPLQRRSLRPVSSYANTSCATTSTLRSANYSKKAAQ
ncbi:uncharacterized protein LOC6586028 [Drosophila mojavensis]|uniref:Uncharacterized protein n=1 Tax=Drosophila mojavensis TaxID=7230 RepID=B4L866_DROMO|nr:uncharacterized protein LOC6586028 [Drosophila mojavensis]EDW05641.1 uncharacterized protein Dmoj_GI11143 [Drosophila mojavensis]